MKSLRNRYFIFALTLLVITSSFVATAANVFAANIPPQIISYQGRLTDGSGTLLGGAGTTYYFKFSLWDSATVGAGNKLWPAGSPTSVSKTVKQGVFNVDIGDTAAGYPDPLTFNVTSNPSLYLQVEVSSDNVSFETLGPRQRMTSTLFAQVAGAIVGTTTPSTFGTTTAATNTFVTIAATSSNTVPLSIAGTQGQTANLFQVLSNLGTSLFSIASNGALSLAVALGAASGGTGFDSSAQTGIAVINAGVWSASSTLSVLRGGTGWGAIQSGSLLYGNGSNALATTSAGTNGQTLALVNGIPTWTATTTAGTGLTYAAGAFSVNSSQNIATLSNLTGNGFVKTSSSNGTLSIDTTTYTATTRLVNTTYPLLGGGDLSADRTFTLAFGTTTANTWSPLQTFTTGLLAVASSTIGAGTQANGLTIFGGATTTGNTALQGALSVTGNTTIAAGTSSAFAISNIPSGSLLKATTGGALIPAIAGTDYANFSYAFPLSATSSLLSFTGGLISSASTTIGNGTAVGGLTVNGTATTTNFAITSIIGSLLKTNTLGQLVAAVANTDYSAFSYPFLNNATSTLLSFTGGASSTAFSANTLSIGGTGTTSISSTGALATPSLTLTGITSGLHAGGLTGGTYSAATSSISAGTGISFIGTPGALVGGTSLTIQGVGYPFALTGNATSTLTQFNGGLTAFASSTIGAGAQATGLTIFGGATTTGNLIVQGAATSTFSNGISASYLNLSGTVSTSTAANGFNLTAGCFAVNNVCIGGGGGSVSSVSAANGTLTISPTTGAVLAGLNLGNANTWTALQQFNANASSTQFSATQAYFGGTATSTFTSAGFLGIGTSTPNWNLQVAGTRPSIGLSDTSAGANLKHWLFSSMGGNLYIGTSTDAFGTSTPSALTLSSIGSLGLGTTSPTARFAMQARDTTSELFDIATSTGGSVFHINALGNVGVGSTTPHGTFGIQGDGGLGGNIKGLVNLKAISSVANNAFTWLTAYDDVGAYRLQIESFNSGGNSNLKFDSPYSMQFQAPSLILTNGGGAGTLQFGGSGGGYIRGNQSTDALHFLPDQIERLTMLNGGNIGIGTTTPNWNLQVAGTRPSLALSDTSAGVNLQHWLFSSMGGNLYIGTSTDSFGTSSPAAFSMDSTGSTTMANGINIKKGCFAMNGVCINYTTRLQAIYATSSAGTTTVNFTGATNANPTFTQSTATLVLPGNTVSYAVEGWGGGGGGGASVTQNGGVGSSTCFSLAASACATNSIINAGGGSGGGLGATGAGGAGGVATTQGMININGFPGAAGTSNAGGGGGGGSPRGGTGGEPASASATVTGIAGSGPGGGGSGGRSLATLVAAGGGGGAYSQNVATTTIKTAAKFVVGAGGQGGNAGTVGGRGADGAVVIYVYATTTTAGATGNDYAEMFPVSNPDITAGDIVAVDRGLPIAMKRAQFGDTAPLAGIISTAPGQLLGDSNEVGSRPVAFSGRVPTKVSLQNGPIKIGDRIAPSSVPGVGMKASVFDDSVGIALEVFDGSEEELPTIMVFIDLHKGINLSELAKGLLSPSLNLMLTFGASTSSATSSEVMNLGTSTPTTAVGTTTPSTGYDFIGHIFAAIIARFEHFGIFVTETALRITTLIADNFTVGSEEKPTGITIYDKKGKPGCLIAEDVETGSMKLLPGACGDQNMAGAAGALPDTSATSSDPTEDTTDPPNTAAPEGGQPPQQDPPPSEEAPSDPPSEPAP